jgi:hypothetical protein
VSLLMLAVVALFPVVLLDPTPGVGAGERPGPRDQR